MSYASSAVKFFQLVLAAVLVILLPNVSAAAPSKVSETSFLAFPLAFEENAGQFASEARFQATGLGYNAFFTANEAVLVFPVSPAKFASASEGAVLRMRIEGMDSGAKVFGEEQLKHTTTYFRSENGAPQSVRSFARLKYKEVYPGIDVVYYGNQGHLEFDFLLAPGAEPDQIKLRFDGATKLALLDSGALLVSTAAGDVQYEKPFAYQNDGGKQQEVAATYQIGSDGIVQFVVGDYDPSQPLVIDPIVGYSTLLWGEAYDMVVDVDGFTYVTGQIRNKDLPAGSGYQRSLAGVADAFVAKIEPSGQKLVFATYLGVRKGFSQGVAIGIDGNKNVYIAGTTDSASFPTTAGAYQRTYSSGASFVSKLNATGSSLLYSTFVNGVQASAIAVGQDGSVYLTGGATALTTTPGALQGVAPGPSSSFVARLNPSGSAMMYATYMSGSGGDVGRAIAVDNDGNAYVTGTTKSTDFPLRNAMQATLRGAQDAFLAKLSPSGNQLIYSTYLGGSQLEDGNGIAINEPGEVFVVGATASSDFPVTPFAFQATKGYPGRVVTNAFISKISQDGQTLLYSSFLGGTWCAKCHETSVRPDFATAVAVDAAGFAYIGGRAGSPAFRVLDSLQPAVHEQVHIHHSLPFVAKVSPSGTRLIYSSIVGERYQDKRTMALGVDRQGHVYALGLDPIASDFNLERRHPTTAGALLNSGPANSHIIRLDTGPFPTLLDVFPHTASMLESFQMTALVQNVDLGGTVVFRAGDAEIGTVQVEAGTAILDARLPPGIHAITAEYSKDGLRSPPVYVSVDVK